MKLCAIFACLLLSFTLACRSTEPSAADLAPTIEFRAEPVIPSPSQTSHRWAAKPARGASSPAKRFALAAGRAPKGASAASICPAGRSYAREASDEPSRRPGKREHLHPARGLLPDQPLPFTVLGLT